MKAGYEVGEQITVLSRQNQWRQCIVQAKRPGQVILPTAPGAVSYTHLTLPTILRV